MPKQHHCRVCGYTVNQKAIDAIMEDAVDGPPSWSLAEDDVMWFHVGCARGEGHEPIPEGWEAYWAER